jgi:hypothetical protein
VRDDGDQIFDHRGRVVILQDERWAHILEGHPELAGHRADVLDAVRRPAYFRQGRLPGEDWFYASGVGPSRYLKVVVAFNASRGSIITAFARRSMP